MKVGVDGVLLGAWAYSEGATRVLDVGTGTGLITLMLAQRTAQARIDAVEIDAAAYRQALCNVNNSPWSDRIRLFHADFIDFATQTTPERRSIAGYDLIVSNPPYFVASLKSPDQQRTTARHSDSLPHAQLIMGACKLLRPYGRMAVILPVEETLRFALEAQSHGLNCVRRLNVQAHAGKSVHRVLSEWTMEPNTCDEQTLCIETGIRHQYTAEYELLTKDFYLDKEDRIRKDR